MCASPPAYFCFPPHLSYSADVDYNLRISEEVIRGAASEGAEVIFLPEAADFITGDAHECFLLSAPISTHKYTVRPSSPLPSIEH